MNLTKLAALFLTAVMMPAVAIAQWDGASRALGASGDSSITDSQGSYTPNAGFKLVKTDMGEMNLKFYT